MSMWAWVLIAVAIVVVIAVAAWQLMVRRRTGELRGQFGPEYDRTLESAESRREAEAELAERKERREQFTLRPLSPTTRSRYVEGWRSVQAQFVDDPRTAVASADVMIQSVMHDCGYPVEDFDQRAADISVDHPDVVENYRQGHMLAERSASGDDSTEDLRRAMQHYRALFEDLVDSNGSGDAAANGSHRVTAAQGEVR
jgi:hypothetical protein